MALFGGRAIRPQLLQRNVGQALGHKGAMTGLGRRFHTKQRADAMDGQ